jgi:predicted N-acetyltransferase YhbS
MLPALSPQNGGFSEEFAIVPERDRDVEAIDALMDASFGAARHNLTVYKLRDGFKPVRRLGFIAIDSQGNARASIRYWPVRVADTSLRYLLLGPLAVDPSIRGGGLGKALIARSLERAIELKFDVCLVVGEPSYYGSFGFTNASALGFKLPGWVELRRFMARELQEGALSAPSSRGLISPA